MSDQPADQQLTPAEIRLAQYTEDKTWSTATYNNGTEKALHEIAVGLKAELDRVRKQRRFLIDQIAKKDAASGGADRKVREFLAGDTPRTPAPAGPTHMATLAVTVTAPTAENASQWIETIADLVHAEHGDHMRLDTRINPRTLPRNGDWRVTRDGVTVHTAATQAEAEAVGTFAIRQEAGPTANVEWICPACYGDYQECQDCSDGTVWYLSAVGVLTEAHYAVERVPPGVESLTS
jgi:hypothetical protein